MYIVCRHAHECVMSSTCIRASSYLSLTHTYHQA